MIGFGSLGCVLLLTLILGQATSKPATESGLRLGSAGQTIKPKSRNPMVVIIDPYKHFTKLLNHVKTDKDKKREEEKDNVPDPKEDAKLLFYNYLRTSPEGELDPEVENHKSFLRSALVARCGKVSSCVKRCPPRRPSCSTSCQEVFDSLNLCAPKKKRKKTYKVTYEFECEDSDDCSDAYGRTMPPRWKMRQ